MGIEGRRVEVIDLHSIIPSIIVVNIHDLRVSIRPEIYNNHKGTCASEAEIEGKCDADVGDQEAEEVRESKSLGRVDAVVVIMVDIEHF